jgi:outer membrane protein W
MKKATFLLSVLFTSFITAQGQGFYLRAGLGYAVPQAGQVSDGNATPYNGTLNNTSSAQDYSVKTASFSAGALGNIGLGYMFNENIGIDVDAMFGLSPKKYTFTAHGVSIGGVASDYSVVQKAKTPIFFTPSVVLQTSGDNMNVYVRFGLVLPLKTLVTQDQIYTNLPGTGSIRTEDFTFEIKNSFSLGFAGAIGVKYRMGENVSLWGEVGIMSLSVLAKQGNLVDAKVDGQSVVLDSVVGVKTINYSKTATIDSTGTQQVTYAQPFSNVGIHVGIIYKLGQNSKSGKGKRDINSGRKKF